MPFISGFPLIRDIPEARRLMEMLVANPRIISRGGAPAGARLHDHARRARGAPDHRRRLTFPGHQAYLYKDRLAGLGVPARIIWGAEDAIVRPVATGFPPQTPVHVIPKAGHLVHLEQAPAVNRLILS